VVIDPQTDDNELRRLLKTQTIALPRRQLAYGQYIETEASFFLEGDDEPFTGTTVTRPTYIVTVDVTQSALYSILVEDRSQSSICGDDVVKFSQYGSDNVDSAQHALLFEGDSTQTFCTVDDDINTGDMVDLTVFNLAADYQLCHVAQVEGVPDERCEITISTLTDGFYVACTITDDVTIYVECADIDDSGEKTLIQKVFPNWWVAVIYFALILCCSCGWFEVYTRSQHKFDKNKKAVEFGEAKHAPRSNDEDIEARQYKRDPAECLETKNIQEHKQPETYGGSQVPSTHVSKEEQEHGAYTPVLEEIYKQSMSGGRRIGHGNKEVNNGLNSGGQKPYFK